MSVSGLNAAAKAETDRAAADRVVQLTDVPTGDSSVTLQAMLVGSVGADTHPYKAVAP